MTSYAYRLRSAEVLAFQYNGETLDALPTWVREFKTFAPMNGETHVARNLVGTLLVPHSGGLSSAYNGDWVVLSGKRMSVMRPDEFAAKYEPTPSGEPETLVVEAAPAPVTPSAPTSDGADIYRNATAADLTPPAPVTSVSDPSLTAADQSNGAEGSEDTSGADANAEA